MPRTKKPIKTLDWKDYRKALTDLHEAENLVYKWVEFEGGEPDLVRAHEIIKAAIRQMGLISSAAMFSSITPFDDEN